MYVSAKSRKAFMKYSSSFQAAFLLAAAMTLFSAAAQASERVPIGNFLIDRTEVTIGAFHAYLSKEKIKTKAEQEGGGYEYASGWVRRPGWSWFTPYGQLGTDQEPVVHVTWSEAQSYCQHVGGRLPSFDEWKTAAYTEMRRRPTDGFKTGRTYRYPVGDTPDGMNNSREKHVAVGKTKQGINGLFDMGANVWEWVVDRRDDDALTAGGSWWYGPRMAEVTGAQWKPAEFYAVYVGFRCAYDGPG
ncbi:MAG: sulfatase modifying factor 1 [Hyphomicrobiaceae bacterium]|jgi:sulfatase modifying factor 1